ncbi:unnamed protein product, partial [Closterium sp. NIES-54]
MQGCTSYVGSIAATPPFPDLDAAVAIVSAVAGAVFVVAAIAFVANATFLAAVADCCGSEGAAAIGAGSGSVGGADTCTAGSGGCYSMMHCATYASHVSTTSVATSAAAAPSGSTSVAPPMMSSASAVSPATVARCPFTGRPAAVATMGESLSREDTEADRLVPIPGPHPLDILGNVRDLSAIALRGIEEATLLYGRKYGPICRFANGVSAWTFVNDADIIAHICSSNSKNYSRRFLPAVYEYVTHGKGILGSQGEYNRAHRRMCQPPFMRPNLLDAFSDTIQSQLDRLITMWRHQAATDAGSPLPNVVLDGNLAVQIQRFTLDIIGAVAFSKDFGQLDRIRADPAGSATEADAGADELLGAVNESQQLMANVFITPLPVLQLLRRLGEPGMLRLDAAMKAMERVMMGVIEERREKWRATGDAGDDLLGVLLGATDEQGRPLQDEELWEDVHDVMGAGHETTATTITAALFLISQHPDAKAKVHEELRALNGRMPSFQDVNSGRLAYTQMAVKETLRMYPPIPLFPREVAHTDVLPGGYELPGGDVVFMSTYAMGRNPLYWPEPLSFRPERFTPEAEAARPRFAWVPFGAGPRMCLGANFAVLAVTQVVATLLQHFEFEGISPSGKELPFAYDITMNFP